MHNRSFAKFARLGLAALPLPVFLLARVAILLGGKVFTSYDTFSYAYRNDPAWDRGPLVSFVGHAPRLWGVPAFYAFFSSDAARAAAQWALGTLAWALLAWVLAGYFRSRAALFLAQGAILILGLLSQVASWDFAILSESLSLSLGVLVLALCLWWLRTGLLWTLAAATATGVWWTFTRPGVFLFVAVLVVALAISARKHGQKFAALTACAVLLAGGVWCTATLPNVDVAHQRYSSTGLTYNRALLVYRLRLHVFADREVEQIFHERLGMPQCPGAVRIAAHSTWDGEDFAREYLQCTELAAWGDKIGDGLWLRFASVAPGRCARLIWQLTTEAVAGAAYAETPRVVPAVAERVAFPSRRHALVIVLAELLVAAVGLLLTGARRSHRRLVRIGAVVGIAALVSAFTDAVWGAGEYSRFGLQAAVALHIVLVLLAACTVDAWLDRRGRRRDASGKFGEPLRLITQQVRHADEHESARVPAKRTSGPDSAR